jgi:hypothetical protein
MPSIRGTPWYSSAAPVATRIAEWRAREAGNQTDNETNKET